MVKEEEATNEMHGDTLESIFSHVPLIDLVPASHVSKSWNRAVFSSLRYVNKPKPWLVIHSQRNRSPHLITTHAYDPRSRVWVQIKNPGFRHVSELRSSHSSLLYTISPTKLSFSSDPLHLTWQHVDVQLSWRTDPIVALAGDYIVIAGGASEFEDDPLAVGLYNVKARAWQRCQNLPATLKDSAASTWLSVATDSRKILVSEKYSGVTYTLEPESKIWSGPYDLRPDPSIFFSTISFVEDRLILIGLIGSPESVRSLKVWEVRGESLEEIREIGAAPEAIVEKLGGSSGREVSSVMATVAGDVIYINNNGKAEEFVVCEIAESGSGCEWSSVENVLMSDENLMMNRVLFSGSRVSLADLKSAMTTHDCQFTAVKS